MIMRLLPFGLALSLAACAPAAVPPDSFHRLELTAPSRPFAAPPPLPGVLEVNRLDAEVLVGERSLVYAEARSGALHRYRYDFWTEVPTVMIQDRLAAWLRAANAAGQVVTPDLRVPPDWVLRGKLKRLEVAADAGSVTVQIQLAVVSARDGQLVLLETYDASRRTGAADVEGAVAAMSACLDDIVARFQSHLDTARIGK